MINKEPLNIGAQVEEDSTHDQLSRNNPCLSLANPFDVVKFDEWRPQDLEAKGHCAQHDFTYLAIGEVLLENYRYGR